MRGGQNLAQKVERMKVVKGVEAGHGVGGKLVREERGCVHSIRRTLGDSGLCDSVLFLLLPLSGH